MIDRDKAIAAIQAIPDEVTIAPSVVPGYRIDELRTGLKYRKGMPSQIPMLGTGAVVIVPPRRGTVSVDARGTASFVGSELGQDQIQFRSLDGKVTLIDLFVV